VEQAVTLSIWYLGGGSPLWVDAVEKVENERSQKSRKW
jgi:hypothetical protein